MTDLSPLEERCAALATTFGRRPLLGRLYAKLLEATEPLCLDDLTERVGAAKSTVCVAMHELEEAGVVQRVSQSQNRRDYYVAADPNQLVQRWQREVLAPELDAWRQTTEHLDIPGVVSQLSQAIALLDEGVARRALGAA